MAKWMMGNESVVRQARLLLVEDDPTMAEVTAELLQNLGHAVVHAPSVRKAMDLVRGGGFDLALLDVNVDKHLVFPVAQKLENAGVPYIFMSGTPGTDIPPEFHTRPFLFKPYRFKELRRVLRPLVGASNDDQA